VGTSLNAFCQNAAATSRSQPRSLEHPALTVDSRIVWPPAVILEINIWSVANLML
jgi:hypothetical protein